MVKVIILNGQGGAGKDSFKNFIKEYDKKKYGVERIADTSMIDRVKHIATMCGWSGDKGFKDRKFLFELKQLLGNYNDLPYKTVKNFIFRIINCRVNDELVYPYIFIDAREAEDIERLVKDFDAITILIKKDKQSIYGNTADDNVFDWNYDYIIDNNKTLEDLQIAAETFWDEITRPERIEKSMSWEIFDNVNLIVYNKDLAFF